jgi:putative heme-binding domain-containing protein
VTRLAAFALFSCFCACLLLSQDQGGSLTAQPEKRDPLAKDKETPKDNAPSVKDNAPAKDKQPFAKDKEQPKDKEPAKDKQPSAKDKKDKKKEPPIVGKEPLATPAESLKIVKGFKVELLYSVPKDKEGSWVNMCVDPKGRLIVSDQYGKLYRITPPAIGGKAIDTKIEPIPAYIGEAHGLLWAFDGLYVVVNRGTNFISGLYRVTSSNNDDVLDTVQLLKKINGGGEHGPHAVLLNPDKKNLTIVCGNGTKLMEGAASRVSRHWGEDHLLPRLPDGRGFMAGVLGPGGSIYEVSPDGQNWTLISTGYRNEFDAAYHKNGDLFTYDADMEWDFNTPWYRPTRVCLAASGSDFGWRNGTGKYPNYYADTWPAIYDIGPGSPTGVAFGYGAKFPARYQDALFISDWSYGKIYAVHLTPQHSFYQANVEEFLSGSPLPVTDLVVNPIDGALYFTIGGRKTKSGFYRVTYTGAESTAPTPATAPLEPAQALRRELEAFHGKQDPRAVEIAWRYLGDDDRFLRNAARVAIEWQDPLLWAEKAFAETNPQARLEALLALVRVSGDDPLHKKVCVDERLKDRLLRALAATDWDRLSEFQKLELLRIYAVLFVRMGPPDDAWKAKLIARFDPAYPAKGRFLNADLCQLLVDLQAPSAATKTLKLLADAASQEEQLEYVKSLRMLKAGWTMEKRREYFRWFARASKLKGGNSFGGFLAGIKRDAVAILTPAEKKELQPILDVKYDEKFVDFGPPRPPYKQYKMEDLTALVEKGLVNRDFDRGRKLFGVANCFNCHRFDNEGGAHGPDLSQAAGRFSVHDLLESIVEPSKVISDQYVAVNIEMQDGRKITGRIINLAGDNMTIMPNMMEPNTLISVNRRLVETMENSKLSMMPTGLLDALKEDEVLDLLAYLLSRGDRNNKMFKK